MLCVADKDFGSGLLIFGTCFQIQRKICEIKKTIFYHG